MPVRHYTRSERSPKYYFIALRGYEPKVGPPLKLILIIRGDKSMQRRQVLHPCRLLTYLSALHWSAHHYP